MLTEISPSQALKTNLYTLHVCSSPTDRLGNFNKLLTSAASQAKDRLLIVAGDFSMKLTTDSRFPSRGGSSVQRDTPPDLTFLENADGSWDNLQDYLGSDHFILEINIRITPTTPKTYTYVDWLVHHHTKEGTGLQDFADALADVYLPVGSKAVTWDNPTCEYKGTPQLLLVQRARAVAEGPYLPAPTWVEPPD
ncbi:hypothetical protein HPB52_021946 [Rhipicephalus sanguineus]|uniref:Endonuclease/exonuclease/phosphatase domain-containing protein n=1 Tax=Rhipicephalus sanguineus TaxID=34632 RepID=A0A9D4Q9G3_RHISA|nr:hypothetical protein HPB52_021946 [Rhipicephalus sanguineus]